MDVLRLGRLVRMLRTRRGWRQEDLATRASLGRATVSLVERGRADRLTLGTLQRLLAPLGASLDLGVRGLGGDIDRLLDRRHAGLVGGASRLFVTHGWEVVAELSYSVWGERGAIDLVAWHSRSRQLAVVEVKTELASLEATLRKHDEKVRLAPGLVIRRFGWRPTQVLRILILPDDRTQRRRVAEHDDVLRRAYPARTRDVMAWLRKGGPAARSAAVAAVVAAVPSAAVAAVGPAARSAAVAAAAAAVLSPAGAAVAPAGATGAARVEPPGGPTTLAGILFLTDATHARTTPVHGAARRVRRPSPPGRRA